MPKAVAAAAADEDCGCFSPFQQLRSNAQQWIYCGCSASDGALSKVGQTHGNAVAGWMLLADGDGEPPRKLLEQIGETRRSSVVVVSHETNDESQQQMVCMARLTKAARCCGDYKIGSEN